MPGKEIKELRQSGQLEKALELALAEYRQEPDNIWTKRNLSWVYYEYAKSNCATATLQAFCENLQALAELQLPEDEKLLFDNIGWLMVKMGFALMKERELQPEEKEQLFVAVKAFHFSKPSQVYSSLFNLFYKIYKDTDNYLTFADWWGFENFRPEDYAEEKMPNGKPMIALVEQAYISYAKLLLPRQNISGGIAFNKERATAFLSKMEELEKNHPEYQYPSFYRAKLLLALGDQNNVLSAILPFAKKKQNAFWVWQILSEAFPSEGDIQFACYCKGLLCPAPDEMTVNLRTQIVPLLIERKMWNEARTEIDKIIEVRKSKNWKISDNLLSYQRSEWYRSASRKRDNKFIYKEYAPTAEAILFRDIPEENVMVSHLNPDKKMLNFITSNGRNGFFKYDRFLKKVAIGDILRVRFQKREESGFCQLATLSKGEDEILHKQYIKHFKGKIRISKTNKFGFVEDVFIMANLCEKYTLSDADLVEGEAIKSFDKKKKQWGWRAYIIHS